LIEPPIAEGANLGTALLFGFIICCISYAAGIGILIMDKIASKRDNVDMSKLKEGETEVVWLSDIKNLNLSFWLISMNCLFTYLGIFPFNNISTAFFRSSYNFNQVQAGRITSTVFLIAAFLAPLFGFMCDKFGHRVTMCIGSASLLTGAHLMYIVLGQCN